MRFSRSWILATFILTLLVIIAGGVVRMTQSGMGCPDWPRCFGSWIPPTHASQLPADFERYLSKQDIDHSFNAYHTWIEYINRLLGVLLGIFAIIQCLALYKQRRSNRRSWSLSKAFLAIVIITGLFGALVVRYNLAHLSISVHLFFAIVLLQVQAALLLSSRGRISTLAISKTYKQLLWGMLIILAIQSILGTTVRMHVDDVSKALNYQGRELWLLDAPAAFLVHRTFSWTVLAIAMLLAWMARAAIFKLQAFGLLAIVVIAMVTGIVMYYFHIPAIAQPMHLLLATLGITQTSALLLQSK